MPLPTNSPKLNTGITIDGKIKALADLVATHERRTFASLVEHAIWLYVQKRLPTEEIERVLLLLTSKPKGSLSGASKSAARSKSGGARASLPAAPVPVRRREKAAAAAKDQAPAKTKSKTKTKAKSKSK